MAFDELKKDKILDKMKIKRDKNKILNVFEKSLEALNKKSTEIKSEKIENKSRVHIGRAPSLASFFEQTLAKELSNEYLEYNFYVDYPISLYLKNERISKQPIYPDILIIDLKEKKLIAIIEIKLDLGYVDVEKESKSVRDSPLDDADSIQFNSIVGAYSEMEKGKNKRIYLTKSQNFHKIVLIVTAKNQHNYEGIGKLETYQQVMTKRGYRVISLLDNHHYNDISDLSKIIKKSLAKKRGDILEIFGEL